MAGRNSWLPASARARKLANQGGHHSLRHTSLSAAQVQRPPTLAGTVVVATAAAVAVAMVLRAIVNVRDDCVLRAKIVQGPGGLCTNQPRATLTPTQAQNGRLGTGHNYHTL